MKKNKDHDKRSADFAHTPFKALKGFTTRQTTPDKKPPPVVAAAEDADDDTLFERAVSGARKLGSDASESDGERHHPAPSAKAAKPRDDEADRNQFLSAMGSIGMKTFQDVIPAPEEETEGQRSSSSRMRQLKRGTIRIGDELDLHGFLRDEALRRLDHFIASAVAHGLQAVLVITGKGINSPEGPVLQGAVAAWLRGQGRGRVAEFFPAPRDKGGSGAFVVFLKTQDKP